MSRPIVLMLFVLVVSVQVPLSAQEITASKASIVLSAIQGTTSKGDTVKLISSKGIHLNEIKFGGADQKYFSIVSGPGNGTATNGFFVILFFKPVENFTGIARATLKIRNLTLDLTGLSTKGLEGENEAPLSLVMDALGYSINTGWTSLANNCLPSLQGAELPPVLFKKANSGNVEMIPVARYSPDFPLNFGYYRNSTAGPSQEQVGVLSVAKDFPEHQTLFPALAIGQTFFDPGSESFGFYAISPDHTLYSEDVWNILFHPTNATHAMRIYPVRDKKNHLLDHTYLVCMEEARNGDYNDYVFLIRNVTPVFIQDEFVPLMNEKDLDGWYTWLQGRGRDNDPEKIFSIEPDGVLHDTGQELGYIMTKRSFGNYHFVLEFKWGEKRWPPRQNSRRDSGICYNIPGDAPDTIWPKSVECQIQEGDTGDFWLLNFSTIQVDGKQNPPMPHSQIVKKKDAEKSTGEWNLVEVISLNGKCVHIVNGVVVNYGENSSLIGGRILLQSEYAEVFYRNIKIRHL
jgi:hypothetical protein